MKKILLTKGKYALVDNEDFDWLNQWKWSFDGRYVQRVSKGKHIRMHRLIMNFPIEDIDHINRNKLDNRRKNLRTVTRTLNLFNKPKQSNNTSGFKGVSWYKRDKRWVAFISKDYKRINLGYFTDAFKASLARKEAEKIYYGIN